MANQFSRTEAPSIHILRNRGDIGTDSSVANSGWVRVGWGLASGPRRRLTQSERYRDTGTV